MRNTDLNINVDSGAPEWVNYSHRGTQCNGQSRVNVVNKDKIWSHL